MRPCSTLWLLQLAVCCCSLLSLCSSLAPPERLSAASSSTPFPSTAPLSLLFHQRPAVATTSQAEVAAVERRDNDIPQALQSPSIPASSSSRAAVQGEATAANALAARAEGHRFHPQQASVFSMERLCASAPFSPRIQPALLPMQNPIEYRSVASNRTVTTSAPWLLMFEGGLLYNQTMTENDVWASTDDGASWDLISGISRFGRSGLVNSASPLSSFTPRVGATNCEDPSTDDVYSLGGLLPLGLTATNDVWFSDHGLEWYRLATSFTPARYFASCDVNSQQHLLMMGGQASSSNTLYNDVWIAQENSWKLQCTRAPWAARAEHLVLVGDNGLLGVELLYVMGGITTLSAASNFQAQSNDVWVSSDEGYSWALVTAAAPWSTRWGHVGVITTAGVLLVIGGIHNDLGFPWYSQNDIWASFDGGVSWSRCQAPGSASFVRGEMGLAVNEFEELLLASGYTWNGGTASTTYNDVWRSTFSLQDADALLPMCNGRRPDPGYGLSSWPKAVAPPSSTAPATAAPRVSSSTSALNTAVARASSSTSSARPGSSSSSSARQSSSTSAASAATSPVRVSSSSSSAASGLSAGVTSTVVRASSSSSTAAAAPPLVALSFSRLTAAAPWSARRELSVVSMSAAVSFVGVNNATVQLSAPWLAMFGGEPGNIGSASNGSFLATLENDVWASANGGSTWQLMAGVSSYGFSGQRASASPLSSFSGRQSARGCAQPSTSRAYSTGGFSRTNLPVNDVWVSSDAVRWGLLQYNASSALFSGRGAHACAFTPNGQLLVIGGRGFSRLGAPGVELNDVWRMDATEQWEQMTEVAPWRGREQHLALYGRAPLLQVPVLYVLGGAELGASTPYQAYNDVWVSSDDGRSWALVTANAPWGPRWGASGLVTSGGALLVMGGAHSDDGDVLSRYTQKDAWASFDGGFSWARCALPASVAARDFVRVEQGQLVDADERMLLMAGNALYPGGLVTSYNDVWRSDLSLADTDTLARLCGGGGLPAAGVGLQAWPSVPAPPTRFDVVPRTLSSPWSPRIQPALLPMYSPITYTRVTDGSTVTTSSPWWLLFEGSLAYNDGPASNENDVWASQDEGASWDLISGISYYGDSRYVPSALPNSSFDAVAGSTNCEDPTSDAIFSLGGLDVATLQVSTEVWRSDDGLHWSKMPQPTFSPGRYFSSCDVNRQQHLLTMGGYSANDGLLNDVWSYADGSWKLVTARAPWPARGEHLVLIGNSAGLQRAELIYVMGGTTRSDFLMEQSNDVWASSDEGYSWVQITDHAPWQPRWGHVGAITAAGVLLVIGGVNNPDPQQRNLMTTYKDVWASFDGGYTWGQCDVRDGDTNAFIRGEQAVALTDAEELLLGTGYLYEGNAPREDFKDMWKSSFSLSNYDALAVMCHSGIPESGIGLTSWPSTNPPPPPPPVGRSSTGGGSPAPPEDEGSSSGGLSGAGVFGVVFAVLLVVLAASAGGYYLYRKRLQSGRPYDLQGGGGALDSSFGPRVPGFGRAGGGGFGENQSSLLSQSDGGGSEFYMEMSTDNKPRISADRQWES